MNKIVLGNYIFSDNENSTEDSGKIINGNYYNKNSLAGDELNVDTIKFSVRFPLTETPNTSITELPYATECLYYQNEVLYGKYYLVTMERTGKFTYSVECQSAIGMLKDTTHYGDVYSGVPANQIINSIIQDGFGYTIDSKYSNIDLYGWLPISTSFENLQQVLYACGGCIKKTIDGNPHFTFLGASTPSVIPKNKTYDGGKISYNSLTNKVNITEHSYVKSASSSKELYTGTIYYKYIVTPQGNIVYGAIITFSEPCYNISVTGGQILNNEYNANYCVVGPSTSSKTITVTGYPYTHITGQIERSLSNYSGKDKIASVTNATLISPANSNTIAQRTLAYYSNAHTLSTSIVSEGEKPLDAVAIQDPFGEVRTGYIESVDGSFSKNMVKGDIEIALDYDPPSISTRTLDSIAITTPPTKTVYGIGQYFDPTGMVVTAYYTNGKSQEITNYTYSPTSALTATDTQITITYSEGGINRAAVQEITFSTQLVSIAITRQPDQMIYNYGDYFNPTGMIVTAYYSNNTEKELELGEYTYTPTGSLTGDITTITISYTEIESGFTAYAYLDISFGDAPELMDIIVDRDPDKMIYSPSESFDPTGMVVNGIFSDESARELKGYTWSPTGPLGMNNTEITISYVWQGGTLQTKLEIEISTLAYINIETPPDKLDYYEGETLDTDGMVVKAFYSTGAIRTLPNSSLTITPNPLKYLKNANIAYSEGNKTCYAELQINVDYTRYEYTKSKVITADYNNIKLQNLIPDITHRNIRVNIINQPQEYKRAAFVAGGSGSGGVSTINQDTRIGTKRTSHGGGLGGSGNPIGGQAGPVFSTDIVVKDWNSYIRIGETTGVNENTGGNKYLTVDGLTYSGNDGEILPNGFTDIFTEKTYAVKGQDTGNDGRGASGGDGADYYDKTTATDGDSVGVYDGGKGYVPSGNAWKQFLNTTHEYHNTEYIPHNATHTQKTSVVNILYFGMGDSETGMGIESYEGSKYKRPTDPSPVFPAIATYPETEVFNKYCYDSINIDEVTGEVTGVGGKQVRIVVRGGQGCRIRYYKYGGVFGVTEGSTHYYRDSPIFDMYYDGVLVKNTDFNDKETSHGFWDVNFYTIESNNTPPEKGSSATAVVNHIIFEYAITSHRASFDWDPIWKEYPYHILSGNALDTFKIINNVDYTYTCQREVDTVIQTDYGLRVQGYVGIGGGGGGAINTGDGYAGTATAGGNGRIQSVAAYTDPTYGNGVKGTYLGSGGGGAPAITWVIEDMYEDSFGKVGDFSHSYEVTGGRGGGVGASTTYHTGGDSAIIIYYS